MNFGELLNGFEFNNHRILDNDVGVETPHELTAVVNFEGNLAFGKQPSLSQFNQ